MLRSATLISSMSCVEAGAAPSIQRNPLFGGVCPEGGGQTPCNKPCGWLVKKENVVPVADMPQATTENASSAEMGDTTPSAVFART